MKSDASCPASVSQIHVYVDTANMDDNSGTSTPGDEKLTGNGQVTVNDCLGFVTVWCEAGKQPSAIIGSTVCSKYASLDNRWYGYKCASFEAGTYEASCASGTQKKSLNLTIASPYCSNAIEDDSNIA